MSWKVNTRSEIYLAEKSRTEGNEGRARVCARRAAGYIIAEYLRREGLGAKEISAISLLRSLQSLPDIRPEVKEVAGHFLVRVTTDHQLPVGADLIAEARWLAEELLGERLD
jgi:hypothetical protein